MRFNLALLFTFCAVSGSWAQLVHGYRLRTQRKLAAKIKNAKRR